MNDWAKGLNTNQLEAANTLEGPLLILAGAGSGKTKTMTSRICHMIEDGIHPGHILAITFTNKAAGEMKARLAKMLNANKNDPMPLVSTFHSFGYKMLSKYGGVLGYKRNLSICDDKDTEKILKAILEEYYYKEKLALAKSDAEVKAIKTDLNSDADTCASLISKCKDYLITEKDETQIRNIILRGVNEKTIEKFITVYTKYEENLKADNTVDFDDLIEKTVFALKDPDVKAIVNLTYTHINVDEFQDTSHAQLELVRLLAGDQKNVCVVGDDYQSIYAFRGAVIDNILTFPDIFDGCKKITLGTNYRSTSHIVDGAAAMIHHNKKQMHKTLSANRGTGEKVQIIQTTNNWSEADFVVEQILAHKARGINYKDMAVLYKKNAQSRSFEDALSKKKIPFIVHGGVGFYQRKEIKDLAAYLKLVNGNDDTLAFERIANVPARGLGKVSLQTIVSQLKARKPGTNLLQSLDEIKVSKPKLAPFADLIKNLQDQAKTLSLPDLVKAVYEQSGIAKEYNTILEKTLLTHDVKKINEVKERINNLEEFISKAAEFEADYIPNALDEGKTMLEIFMEEVSLYTDAEKKNKNEDAVNLMTVHKSKGLEFDVVFLTTQDEENRSVGFNDDPDDESDDERIPRRTSNVVKEDVEEERRVFYVGMTRAKDFLYITYCKERYQYGDIKLMQVLPYLSEIPMANVQYTVYKNVKASGYY